MNKTNLVAQWLRDAQACLARGDLIQAEAIARRIRDSGVAHPAIASFMAQLERERGNAAAACDWMDRALAMAPGEPRLHLNRAAMRLAARDYPGAADDAELAARQMPDSFGAWLNLGLAREALERPHQALVAFERALALRPDDLSALRGKAQALYRSGFGHHRSRALLEKVVERDPDDAMSRLLLANSLVEDAQIEPALEQFRELLTRHPDFHQAHSTYLVALQLHPGTGPARLLDEHRQWARQHLPAVLEPLISGKRRRESNRLRIGWLSPRFAEGPMATLVLPVMEVLSGRDDCEQVIYPAYPLFDAIGERFRDTAWVVRELRSDSAEDVARQIAEDDLDVLIDLAGHAPENRLHALARHPAPLQILWGDYFCTSGVPGLDVFLSDDHLSPPGDGQWFSERLVRLARGRFPYRPMFEVPEPADRNGKELVFGCFNRISKLNDDVLAAWARILMARPDAVLVLRARGFNDDQARTFFLERARRLGLPPDRLRLHGASDYAGLMTAYGDIDIALDPFPFSGQVTSADALWMGVPVVTRTGATLVSRQTGALLSSLGLNDLVAEDVDGYVGSALALAGDVERRNRLRFELRELVSVRLDPTAFAVDFLAVLNRLVADGDVSQGG